ncbi:DEAD/DEAH box helicase family protein [Pseudactinotalea sp. Z1732]|uniref:DEAD/DEAH box helicase family protein n=1 Tax=Pseudactinotalea sp. Z1732 TaxID=3413026 RepID=UPI003C7A88F9
MSNFAFVKAALPTVHPDCVKAESYLSSDPRAACFYSRRAIEHLVAYLYEVLNLTEPYRDDLAARINDSRFKTRTGNSINQKLNLIRRLGNTAVHEARSLASDHGLAALRELHHVVVWAAFHHSADPAAVPVRTPFDPTLAAKAAPLSRDELVRLAKKFQEQDEAHARELAQRDELLAAHEERIAQLQAQIASAQDAKAAAGIEDTRDYSEAQTREAYIDVDLRAAGWLLDQDHDREYPVAGMPGGGRGYIDYVLWGSDGLPLAVVEAKRAGSSVQVGRQQAELYADRLEAQFGRRPVIFYTNGYEHWLWDDAAGYPPRKVQGFCTRDELELMVQRRHTRMPLATATVDTDIAGRPYQVRAIKAIGEVLDSRERRALLVMATGSGKTRTVIALVDQLMKAGWVKRVLFLADRNALVRQAVGAFKEHLPAATTVNLVTERDGEGRVYVSTYPTIMNLINEADDDATQAQRFGPGHFDLVIIDEAHRSVYAKYGVIFDYFDAILVGLTATPKDEVDYNTYRLFDLEEGVPTDAYSLEDAVADGYLVPPKGVSVGTKFLRRGIRYDELSEDEKDQWDVLDWGEGEAPDEVGAEELNRFLFNTDTVDKVLETLMTRGYKVAGGDRIGKTIIFAKNQRHAEFIAERFDINWPGYAGHFARTITHASPYAQQLIEDFATPTKAPHIAISVDMLDTGIDIPEVVNLVFFKTVWSKSKYWQMIGRGTRLRPDLFGPGADKTDFLVFDFCGNLEYFNQDLPGSEGSIQKSLTQHLFEARVALARGLQHVRVEPDLRRSITAALQQTVAGMHPGNVLVRPHRRAVERFSEPSSWVSLSSADAEDVLELAGLPSSVRDEDEHAKRFDLLILRRQLADLEGDTATADRLRKTIQAIAGALLGKTTIPMVAEQATLLEAVASDGWWVDVTLPMLESVRKRMRSLVRLADSARRNPVYTDFVDELGEASAIELAMVTPGTDLDRFRQKAAAYLVRHQDHVALQRLRRNRQLTPEDLAALEQMLLASGTGEPQDIAAAAEQTGGLGLFIRSLVGLDRQAATEAFADYLDAATFTVNQVRFVELVVEELTANGMMEPGRLFESPYTDHGRADLLFTDSQVDAIVATLRDIKARAIPESVA